MNSQRDTPQTEPSGPVKDPVENPTTEYEVAISLPFDPLFDEVYQNFQKKPKDDFELFIPPSTDPAEIRLLFEEVYRNLTQRKRSAFESKKIITSEQRQLDSKPLAVKAFQTAKVVKVKEAEREKKAKKAQTLRREMLADQQVILRPALIDRIGSILIDTTGVLAATMITAIPFTLLLYPLDLFALLTGSPLPNTTLLLSGLVFGLLPLMVILYNAFWTIYLGRTPGHRFSQLVLIDMQNNRPHFSNLVIRATLMPVSLVFLGCITPILGLRSLADLLSNTQTIQEYSSISDGEEEE